MVEPSDDANHHGDNHDEAKAEVRHAPSANTSLETQEVDPFASRPSERPDSLSAAVAAEQIVVQRHDVLLGRGKGMETHYGNQLFQHLIRCNVARYIHAPNREAKRAIIFEIIASIEQKGRFLKCEGRDWVVLEREESRKKVAHALQYHLRTLR